MICPRKCVCWPDGDFTVSEQQVLDAVSDLVVTAMYQHVFPDLWVTLVTKFLVTWMAATNPRRLAHLLSVPVRLNDFEPMYGHGMTLPYCFMGHVVDKPVADMGTVTAIRLFLQLPLCPHVGSPGKAGWRKHEFGDRHRHPGRCFQVGACTGRSFTLVHRVCRNYSRVDWLFTALGAYPMCGCKYCKWSVGARSSAIHQWHRWWARPAERTWVFLSVTASADLTETSMT